MKHSLRIALFHTALRPDNLTYNCNLLQAMIRQTRPYRPGLIVTPELALSGYEFHAAIGLDWIHRDAYTPAIADELLRQGAEALISPAAWAPGQYGPDGEWEQRSRETGLPLLVCNRTGSETTMNFNGSSSAVVVAGRRVLDYAGAAPAILICDVAADDWRLLSQEFQIIPVPPDPPGA